MNKKVISKITSGVLLCTMLAYTTPVLAFTKDETVYSKIDSNGNNYNTIVNDHIINDEQEQLINDISDLLNIKNVNINIIKTIITAGIINSIIFHLLYC